MKQSEIKEFIEKGYVRANVIFEVVGKPKEHVENTIKAYVENIATNKEIQLLKEEYEPAEEVEDGLFATLAETEMLIENLEKLNWVCVNFSPASVEILEPKEITMGQGDLGKYFNDLLARLHEIGMLQKTVNSKNQGLLRNFNAMTRNAILLSLVEPRDIDYICKKIGMGKDHAEKFLDALIQEKRVEKTKQLYKLI